jgi:hypothetical protein
MMNRLLVVLSLAIGVAVLNAQASARARAIVVVVGCAVDTAWQSPAEGVTVWMRGGTDTSSSDSTGFFRVSTQRSGSLDTLLMRRIAFVSEVRPVRIEGGNTVVLGTVAMRWSRNADGISIDQVPDSATRRKMREISRRFDESKVRWPGLMKSCLDSLAKLKG